MSQSRIKRQPNSVQGAKRKALSLVALWLFSFGAQAIEFPQQKTMTRAQALLGYKAMAFHEDRSTIADGSEYCRPFNANLGVHAYRQMRLQHNGVKFRENRFKSREESVAGINEIYDCGKDERS